MSTERTWKVYLSGEIHTDWRERLVAGCEELGLDVEFTGPQTDHGRSDDCGVAILGEEERSFWKDRKGASLNAIRNSVHMDEADLMVVRFGDKYRQWNAAFDAGQAAGVGLPYVTLHDEALDHALKEVDAAAHAVAREPEQVVDLLRYTLTGELPERG